MTTRSRLLLSAILVGLGTPAFAGDDFAANRIDLHNGGEIFYFLNDPFEPDDSYFKVLPAQVLRRDSGVMSVTALEFTIGESDITTDTTLWALAIHEATENAGGELEPVGDPIVFLDAIDPLGFASTDCPEPGFLTMLELREVFIDPITGETGSLVDLVADGTTNYAIVHHFPGGQSVSEPVVNGCGGTGDASFMWYTSTDLTDPEGGENGTDWLDTGTNPWAGFDSGGNRFYLPPEEQPTVTALFGEPTLEVRVDADVDGGAGIIEVGLAGLNLPVGIDAGGGATGTTPRVGVQLHDKDATPGTSLGLAAATLAPPLAVPVPIFGAFTLLDVSDPLFGPTARSFDIGTYEESDSGFGDAFYQSELVTITPAPSMVNMQLALQGHTIEPDATIRSTNAVVMHLRAND